MPPTESELLQLMRQAEENFRNRHERRRPESTLPGKDESEYWRMVFSEPAKPALTVTVRREREAMAYEEARRSFWKSLVTRGNAIAEIEDRPFQWEFNDDMKAVIRNLLLWALHDPESEYPINKGLFVYGAPGVGKTEIMDVLGLWMSANNFGKAFSVKSMSTIYAEQRTIKDFDALEIYQQNTRCFDEFGRTTGPVKVFGNDIDLNEAIIEARYERFRKFGQITCFISNGTPEEFENMLTPMILDRLRAMCTPVWFSGKSKRV